MSCRAVVEGAIDARDRGAHTTSAQRSHEQTYSAGLSIAAVTLVGALNRQFE